MVFNFFMIFAWGVFSWHLCVFSLLGKFSGFWCICNEVDEISWFLWKFMKLAKVHNYCGFSLSWQNFMIFVQKFMFFVYFHVVEKISLFLWIFYVLTEILQDFMIFARFHEVGKIQWFLHDYIKFSSKFSKLKILWL